MIDVYFRPTGNGKKITIMLEECGLACNVIPVNINKEDQSTPRHDAINPNNKMPAMIDRAPAGGGTPITVFESGAILQYLGERPAKSWLPAPRANTGCSAGSNGRWGHWGPWPARRIISCAMPPRRSNTPCTGSGPRSPGRTRSWTRNESLAGDCSIADIAPWSWVVRQDWQGQDLKKAAVK